MVHMNIAIFLSVLLLLVTSISYSSAEKIDSSKNHVVSITGCKTYGVCFVPCQITVLKGDTVTWVNRDTKFHMVISGNNQGGPDGWFSSSFIPQNGAVFHKFDRKGVFTYFDNTSPSGQGVVIVDSSLDSNFVKTHKAYFSDWWCTKN